MYWESSVQGIQGLSKPENHNGKGAWSNLTSVLHVYGDALKNRDIYTENNPLKVSEMTQKQVYEMNLNMQHHFISKEYFFKILCIWLVFFPLCHIKARSVHLWIQRDKVWREQRRAESRWTLCNLPAPCKWFLYSRSHPLISTLHGLNNSAENHDATWFSADTVLLYLIMRRGWWNSRSSTVEVIW